MVISIDVSDIILYAIDGYSHCVTQLLSLFDYLRVAQVVLGATIFECELLYFTHATRRFL